MLLCLSVSSLAAAQDAPAEPSADPPSDAPPDDGLGELEEEPAAPAEPAPEEPPQATEEPEAAEPEPTPIDEGSEPALEAEAIPEEATPTEASEEIVITGSRIKRTAFSTAAPVDIVDRTQLEHSGATNLADVVQYMTVSQGTGSQGNIVGGGAVSGVATMNLRGLGEGATLILINGRRVNPSGGGVDNALVDMSIVPLAAVERIEILKAGASALYGADAVGGVVNIITRKNWSGMRIELDGQMTQDAEQKDFTGSAAFGANDERSRVLIASSYMRRTELTADQRDFTEGYYISTQGQPGAYVLASATGMATATGATPDPACTSVEGSAPMMTSATSTVCSFGYRQFATLMGNLERVNVFGSAEYDLTDHTTGFIEANASRMRGDNIGSPSLPLLPFPLVPADHIDNPFRNMDGSRSAVLWVGRPLGAEAGPTRTPFADDTFRAVLGIKGDFEDAAEDTLFESWEWELFTMMGISRYRYTFIDNLREPLLEALNSCSDPSDLSGCFNPFYSAIDGTGTPNSDAVISSFTGEMMILNDHALQTYNGGMTGSLFELPGGDLGLAFGGEVRHEWRTGELDHDANEDRYVFFVGNPDNQAERDVYSGYLELNFPFYDGIELQTAGRLEHYTDIESTALSPFAGLTLMPADWGGRENAPDVLQRLVIRSSVSTAFRAPTIRQSDRTYQTIPTPLRLVAGSPLATFLPVRQYGNPEIDPETAFTLSAGFQWTIIDQLSLLADIWHYDYVDRIDSEDPQQIINVDMVTPDSRVERDDNGNVNRVNVRQINVSGSTVTNGLDFGVMLSFPGARTEDEDWNLSLGVQGTYTLTYDIPREQTSTRSLPANPATGAAAMVAPPADCEGSSAVDFDMDPNNDGANDSDACSVVGKRNAANFAPPVPVLRANFPIVFSASGHSVALIGHYISGLEDDVLPNPDGSFDTIDPFTTFDLQYGFTIKDVIGKALTLRVGCANVLDAYPPEANGSTVAYEAGVHDPRGRLFYAKLSSEL